MVVAIRAFNGGPKGKIIRVWQGRHEFGRGMPPPELVAAPELPTSLPEALQGPEAEGEAAPTPAHASQGTNPLEETFQDVEVEGAAAPPPAQEGTSTSPKQQQLSKHRSRRNV